MRRTRNVTRRVDRIGGIGSGALAAGLTALAMTATTAMADDDAVQGVWQGVVVDPSAQEHSAVLELCRRGGDWNANFKGPTGGSEVSDVTVEGSTVRFQMPSRPVPSDITLDRRGDALRGSMVMPASEVVPEALEFDIALERTGACEG